MRMVEEKKYLRIQFILDSPLALGSGDNDRTDKDLMYGSDGKPYIPASAIAGVIRELCELSSDKMNAAEIRECFGAIKKVTENGKADGQTDGWGDDTRNQLGSKIVFYDATLTDNSSCHISIRDSVALDEYKTAKKGAKFDMEVLEAGATFVTYLEETVNSGGRRKSVEKDISDGTAASDDNKTYLDRIIDVLSTGKIRFGGKTTRGYGDVSIKSIDKTSFCINDRIGVNENGLKSWLDFDLYDLNSTTNWESVEGVDFSRDSRKVIRIGLKLNGGISIRKYTTEPNDDPKNKTIPDQEQLKSHRINNPTETENAEEKKPSEEFLPVIPGTSWAGAIRHRMCELMHETSENDKTGERKKPEIDEIFGFVIGEGKNQKSRSKLRFGESYITGGTDRQISRNAIDRFTGGTVDGALFTERTHYGGETELEIEWLGKEPIPPRIRKALAAALTDLHLGFLAVGGETSIGRGLFSIVSIDRNKLEDELKKTHVNNVGANSETDNVGTKLFRLLDVRLEEVFV